jgi:hypothetical protein
MTSLTLCQLLFALTLLCSLASVSAVAQQDTFNVQTQPEPMNPSDVFSSDDCRTNPGQVLQQWDDYYKVMRSVIDRRDH